MPRCLARRIQRCLVSSTAKRDFAFSCLPRGSSRLVERNIHLKFEGLYKTTIVRLLKKQSYKKHYEQMALAHCFVCDTMCSPIPERRPWVWLEVAGTTCVAFSQINPDAPGFLHASSVPCFAWLFWVLCTMPEAATHECVKRFNPLIFYDVLGLFFHINSIVFCGSSLGLPGARERRYTLMRKKSCWLALNINKENLARAACRTCVADARMFFLQRMRR